MVVGWSLGRCVGLNRQGITATLSTVESAFCGQCSQRTIEGLGSAGSVRDTKALHQGLPFNDGMACRRLVIDRSHDIRSHLGLHSFNRRSRFGEFIAVRSGVPDPNSLTLVRASGLYNGEGALRRPALGEIDRHVGPLR